MQKLINDILTEKDGVSVDPVRLCGLLGFIIYNIISVIQALKPQVNFDYVQYATGMSIILGVISAGITYKYSKEKDVT